MMNTEKTIRTKPLKKAEVYSKIRRYINIVAADVVEENAERAPYLQYLVVANSKGEPTLRIWNAASLSQVRSICSEVTRRVMLLANELVTAGYGIEVKTTTSKNAAIIRFVNSMAPGK